MNEQLYRTCSRVLKEELIPALGCTEPIAIAYAAAKAREVLGQMPDKITAQCSGNIIKNVRGVVVPGTGNMKGIETSAILGALVGGSHRVLEVLTAVTPSHITKAKELLAAGICTVELLKGSASLRIIITASGGGHHALVEIADRHNNIVRVERDGAVEFSASCASLQKTDLADRSCLNMRLIFDYATAADLADVEDVLARQVALNTAIARQGLDNPYGLQVGAGLLRHYGADVKIMAKAMPAAGSDARMAGCDLPVVINSGSGNQGMTVSLPVIAFAKHLGADKKTLYRALALSNLTAIHLKTGLGRLSAYCGVVSAACGSGAAITYLHGGDFDAVTRTVTNILGNVSGIVCDGAKSSCAAKIASAVDAAIMSHYMAWDNRVIAAGEGLTAPDVEQTIRNIGRLGRDGMRETDHEILQMMMTS